jgi:orotidine-5'-phosphate decarboxylase
MKSIRARDRLIVALDVPNVEAARATVRKIGASADFYKIGHQLAFSGGLDYVRELKDAGKSVFLDLKLLDIDNTVEKGVESILALGADMLTIHAYPKAMAAAVRAASGSGLCLLGVTVLTSMDDEDLAKAGYAFTARDLVMRRAVQAASAGMGGVVCSPQEAAAVRQAIGGEMVLVTPGIRPSGTELGDQKRVLTPGDAMRNGATYLVVGRPVTSDPDPAGAADAIIAEISAAEA